MLYLQAAELQRTMSDVREEKDERSQYDLTGTVTVNQSLHPRGTGAQSRPAPEITMPYTPRLSGVYAM